MCFKNYNLFFLLLKSGKKSVHRRKKTRLLHPFLSELHSGISQIPEYNSLGVSCAPIVWFRNKGF